MSRKFHVIVKAKQPDKLKILAEAADKIRCTDPDERQFRDVDTLLHYIDLLEMERDSKKEDGPK